MYRVIDFCPVALRLFTAFFCRYGKNFLRSLNVTKCGRFEFDRPDVQVLIIPYQCVYRFKCIVIEMLRREFANGWMLK